MKPIYDTPVNCMKLIFDTFSCYAMTVYKIHDETFHPHLHGAPQARLLRGTQTNYPGKTCVIMWGTPQVTTNHKKVEGM